MLALRRLITGNPLGANLSLFPIAACGVLISWGFRNQTWIPRIIARWLAGSSGEHPVATRCEGSPLQECDTITPTALQLGEKGNRPGLDLRIFITSQHTFHTCVIFTPAILVRLDSLDSIRLQHKGAAAWFASLVTTTAPRRLLK